MNSELGIDTLTIGIDSNGMQNYRESLRIDLLQSTEQKINEFTEVEAAINNCWQGLSRDYFLDSFEDMRQRIIQDLEAEYRDLENRLVDLEEMYYKQDLEMLGGEE